MEQLTNCLFEIFFCWYHIKFDEQKRQFKNYHTKHQSKFSVKQLTNIMVLFKQLWHHQPNIATVKGNTTQLKSLFNFFILPKLVQLKTRIKRCLFDCDKHCDILDQSDDQQQINCVTSLAFKLHLDYWSELWHCPSMIFNNDNLHLKMYY